MAIAIRGASGAYLYVANTTPITLPAVTNAGDAIILVQGCESSGDIAPSGAGATWVQCTAVGDWSPSGEMLTWLGYNCSAGNSQISVASASNTSQWTTYSVAMFSGVPTTGSSLGATATANAGTVGPISFVAGDLVIAAAVMGSGNTPITWSTLSFSGGTASSLGSRNATAYMPDTAGIYMLPSSAGSTSATFAGTYGINASAIFVIDSYRSVRSKRQ